MTRVLRLPVPAADDRQTSQRGGLLEIVDNGPYASMSQFAEPSLLRTKKSSACEKPSAFGMCRLFSGFLSHEWPVAFAFSSAARSAAPRATPMLWRLATSTKSDASDGCTPRSFALSCSVIYAPPEAWLPSVTTAPLTRIQCHSTLSRQQTAHQVCALSSWRDRWR
jgi:hypothetical protein